MRSYRGTRSTVAPLTLLLIASTRSAASSTTVTPTSTENVRAYLAIMVSARINIVCKQVTKIAKDIRAINRRLSRLKDSLSKIKDKLAFIRRGITTLIRNARLPDIEFK
jgi:septal ring factor EnvC (AmiA/AmiB activator)